MPIFKSLIATFSGTEMPREVAECKMQDTGYRILCSLTHCSLLTVSDIFAKPGTNPNLSRNCGQKHNR